jgi:hypothetical protein
VLAAILPRVAAATAAWRHNLAAGRAGSSEAASAVSGRGSWRMFCTARKSFHQ